MYMYMYVYKYIHTSTQMDMCLTRFEDGAHDVLSELAWMYMNVHACTSLYIYVCCAYVTNAEKEQCMCTRKRIDACV